MKVANSANIVCVHNNVKVHVVIGHDNAFTYEIVSDGYEFACMTLYVYPAKIDDDFYGGAKQCHINAFNIGVILHRFKK